MPIPTGSIDDELGTLRSDKSISKILKSCYFIAISNPTPAPTTYDFFLFHPIFRFKRFVIVSEFIKIPKYSGLTYCAPTYVIGAILDSFISKPL